MNRVVRRKLEMAVRVRDFSRAHPSADANYAPLLSRLEELIARMETLAQQQQGGYLARRSSASRRRAVRERIHGGLLRHLVTVAEVAAKDAPQLAERFVMPSGNATNEAFRTLAQKLLKQGQASREVLAQHGLAEHLLDDLAAALNQYDASLVESNEGRRDHVGARADLVAVSREIMDLVELLDGLNRYRFGSDAELRAAWESARNVVSGPKPAEEPAAGAVEGKVKPAA